MAVFNGNVEKFVDKMEQYFACKQPAKKQDLHIFNHPKYKQCVHILFETKIALFFCFVMEN